MKKAEFASLAFKRVSGWLWARKRWMIYILLIALLLLPQPSQSQIPFLSPCCGILAAALESVTDAVSDVIGNGLNVIGAVLTSIEEFQRVVVWPEDLIDEARATVGSVQGILDEARTTPSSLTASSLCCLIQGEIGSPDPDRTPGGGERT